MSDEKRLPDPISLLPRLPKGSAIILRHYGVKSREAIAKKLVKAGRRNKIRILISNDLKLAIRCGAHGVHWSSRAAEKLAGAPRRPCHNWLVSTAVHSRKEAAKAQSIAADLVLISPVFPTLSHPNRQTLGPRGFQRLARISKGRTIPLGGVDAISVRCLKGVKICGLSGIGLFLTKDRK